MLLRHIAGAPYFESSIRLCKSGTLRRQPNLPNPYAIGHMRPLPIGSRNRHAVQCRYMPIAIRAALTSLYLLLLHVSTRLYIKTTRIFAYLVSK